MTPEQFTAGLAEAAVAMGTDLAQAFEDGGNQVRDKWKSNAAASSGSHAKGYPSHITASTRVGSGVVAVEVGPWMKGQGDLGSVLEDGSENNPAHHDGLNAVEEQMPRLERRVDAVIGFLLP